MSQPVFHGRSLHPFPRVQLLPNLGMCVFCVMQVASVNFFEVPFYWNAFFPSIPRSKTVCFEYPPVN